MNENTDEGGDVRLIAKNNAYAFWVDVFNIYLPHNKSGINPILPGGISS